MKRLSTILALVSLLAVLIIGVPLFLRTPVWVDVTYHDLSAWNVLNGGVHYRDVFETNLPGMVWLHAAIRPLIGWSHEAIRIVDLLVVSAVLVVLLAIMRRIERPEATKEERIRFCLWFLVAGYLFYLFETEFIHCQRDGWMLLPATLATYLRCARGRKRAIVEGMLWGLAVWIKPHVLLPALLVWMSSLRFETRRTALVESFWLLVGGAVMGLLGSVWLIWSGAWSPMWDVLLNWNHEYYSWSWSNTIYKVKLVSTYFPPFSVLHFAAIPLALFAVFRRDPARAALAALYLGWLAQATFIQKEFDYAHAPPTLLGLAVLAAHRWPVGRVFLGWCLLAGLANEWMGKEESFLRLESKYPKSMHVLVPHHPIARTDRLALWPRCFHDDSWELKDRLTYYPRIHCAPHWTDLERVAQFLETKDLKDRELICWHDSTHPLYVRLGIKPGIRYPHVITAMKFKSKREQIRKEAFESPARYVVSDLVPIEYLHSIDESSNPNSLPDNFPAWRDEVYPWNQPVVFRAGRFVVHEVKEPRGRIEFPFPEVLMD